VRAVKSAFLTAVSHLRPGTPGCLGLPPGFPPGSAGCYEAVGTVHFGARGLPRPTARGGTHENPGLRPGPRGVRRGLCEPQRVGHVIPGRLRRGGTRRRASARARVGPGTTSRASACRGRLATAGRVPDGDQRTPTRVARSREARASKTPSSGHMTLNRRTRVRPIR